MRKDHVNYEEIDLGVRDLVAILNGTLFISTQSSCEGHLKDKIIGTNGKSYILPEQGFAFLYEGHLYFRVDKRYKAAIAFLNKIEDLQNKYPFVDYGVHRCHEPQCSIEGSSLLTLGTSDLTHQEFTAGDSLDQWLRKRDQVPIIEAEKRIGEYRQVWSDVLAFARKLS